MKWGMKGRKRKEKEDELGDEWRYKHSLIALVVVGTNKKRGWE